MKTIYYCTSGPAVAGGQHVNAEHVAELREAGLRAYLLHIPSTSETESFQSIAPVLQISQIQKFLEDDVVVVPESWRDVLRYFSSKKVRKIIHCQNPFYLFHSFESIHALVRHGYREVISCSGFTAQMIRQFGYEGTIYTIRPSISESFFANQSKPRKLQIAYMPRKRAVESEFIKGLFRSHYPNLNKISWVPIENKSRLECAAILQESSIFAAFGHIEGLGLPPLEAMASGCIVVGFHGLGGAEYANPQNGFWVEEGDYFGFARQLSKAVEAAEDPAWRLSLSNEGGKTIAPFKREFFRTSLLETWKELLGRDFAEYAVTRI